MHHRAHDRACHRGGRGNRSGRYGSRRNRVPVAVHVDIDVDVAIDVDVLVDVDVAIDARAGRVVDLASRIGDVWQRQVEAGGTKEQHNGAGQPADNRLTHDRTSSL